MHRIARADFNHGTTRQQAIEQFAADADVVVFLTQDAVLTEPTSLQQLVDAFDDPTVAAAMLDRLLDDVAQVVVDSGREAAAARLSAASGRPVGRTRNW